MFIPIHLIFEILAFYCGFAYYQKLRDSRTDHFTNSQRLTLILAACIGALIGSRLLAAAEHYAYLRDHFSLVLLTQSKTIVGGIIGGWIGIEITKKYHHITESSGDLFTLPLILGLIIGRIGCFLTGVSDGTAGIPSHLPWALDQGDGVLRHPTAIYEILFLGILWGVLHIVSQNATYRNGDIFRMFMVSYAMWRFAVEFIKPVPHLAIGLSAIQISCLLVLAYHMMTTMRQLTPSST